MTQPKLSGEESNEWNNNKSSIAVFCEGVHHTSSKNHPCCQVLHVSLFMRTEETPLRVLRKAVKPLILQESMGNPPRLYSLLFSAVPLHILDLSYSPVYPDSYFSPCPKFSEKIVTRLSPRPKNHSTITSQVPKTCLEAEVGSFQTAELLLQKKMQIRRLCPPTQESLTGTIELHVERCLFRHFLTEWPQSLCQRGRGQTLLSTAPQSLIHPARRTVFVSP